MSYQRVHSVVVNVCEQHAEMARFLRKTRLKRDKSTGILEGQLDGGGGGGGSEGGIFDKHNAAQT